MSSVPFYLDPNPQGSTSIFSTPQVLPALDITTDYNYSLTREPADDFDPTAYFSKATESSLAYLGGAIDKSVEGVKGLYTGLKGELGELKDGIFDSVDSVLLRGGLMVAFFLGGVLLIMFVITKTGLSKDVVAGMKVFFG